MTASKRHSSVQEALDWFAAVGWLDDSPARRHFKTLVEQLEAAGRQVETYKEMATDQRDRANALQEQFEALESTLRGIADKQQHALAIIQDNGFVFDDIGNEPGNWKHLAFTLYNEICEIDVWARNALDIEFGEPASNPASTQVAAPDLAAPGNDTPDHRPGEGAAHILRTPDPNTCPDCGSIRVLNAGTRTHRCGDCGCLFFPSNQESRGAES